VAEIGFGAGLNLGVLAPAPAAVTKKPITCAGGVAPSMIGPKGNWYEVLPDFWLPFGWIYDGARWPDYTQDFIASRLEQADDISDLLVFRDFGEPTPKAWAAWIGAFGCDRPLNRNWLDLEIIADKKYDIARYRYLVPAWRRAITEVIGDIDDVEDQISTILWVLQWISKKVVPLPPTLMNRADQLRHTLDCGEKVLAGITPFRSSKADFANCRRSTTIAITKHRTRKAQLLQWFRDNWGKTLEAAQATGTWFDVGIILGPVMGWIEEGLWGLAAKTLDNYLVAVDAVLPGYSEDFKRSAEELGDAVDQVWESTWEPLNAWDNENILDQFPGFEAP
jgi:hypothetical protein